MEVLNYMDKLLEKLNLPKVTQAVENLNGSIIIKQIKLVV